MLTGRMGTMMGPGQRIPCLLASRTVGHLLPLLLLCHAVRPVHGQSPAPYATNGINSLASPCPVDPSQFGYTSIADMNTDQIAVLDALTDGAPDQGPYNFPVCPFTDLDVASEGPLRTYLDNITFACGERGDPTQFCNFRGGTNQVVVPTAYAGSATFVGVTFSDCNGTVIEATYQEEAHLTFLSVLWLNNDGIIIDTSPYSVLVTIANSSVTGGGNNTQGAPQFTVQNGKYTLSQVYFSNINTERLLSVQDDGILEIADVYVSYSSIQFAFASCLSGGNLIGNRVYFYNENNPYIVFYTTGGNSRMSLADVDVYSNNDYSVGWTVFHATASSEIVAERVRVFDNIWLRVRHGSCCCYYFILSSLLTNGIHSFSSMFSSQKRKLP
jgi:hypothetical protein